MAAVHGKAGTCTTGGGAELTTVQSWTINFVGETADITGMGSSWTSSIDGITDFTVAVEALAQTAVDIPADLGESQTLTLEIVGGGTEEFVCDAVLTSVTETVSIDDVGRLSMTFEGNDLAVASRPA